MKKAYGFTIVELLIVIVVIGIIASFILNSVANMRVKATASNVVQTLKQVEKGVRAYAIDQQWTEWPTETQFAPGHPSPVFNELIEAEPDFAIYLKPVKDIENVPGDGWMYDYDLTDTSDKTHCGFDYFGVNIQVANVPQNIAQEVDNQMDERNLECGIVRFDPSNNRLFYAISYSSSFDIPTSNP